MGASSTTVLTDFSVLRQHFSTLIASFCQKDDQIERSEMALRQDLATDQARIAESEARLSSDAARVNELQYAFNSGSVEANWILGERQGFQQVNRDLTQRITVLEETNRANVANIVQQRDELDRATTIHVVTVSENMTEHGNTMVGALDGLSDTIEGLVAEIERISEMNLGPD